MARLLIVDDDALVRAGLRMILESADDLEVVGEAADGAEVVTEVQGHHPDVVLMDIRMPRMDGLRATTAVRAMPNPPTVIVLTTFDLDDFVFRALRAGAAGFLLKDTPPRAADPGGAGGRRWRGVLSPGVTRRLISHFADDPRTERRRLAQARLTGLTGLTDRERDVLIEVGKGLSNHEIGAALYLSEATVKAHASRLLVKLDAANRVQVAILAHEAGLLD